MEEMNSLILMIESAKNYLFRVNTKTQKEVSLVFECIKAVKVLIREKTKQILLIGAFLIIQNAIFFFILLNSIKH